MLLCRNMNHDTNYNMLIYKKYGFGWQLMKFQKNYDDE